MIKKSDRNTKTSKLNHKAVNKSKASSTTISKKPKPKPKNKQKASSTTISKKNKNKPAKDGLDEKGNPLPMDDPEGGSDPICPTGFKIDYDFDPFNDPINPPFRCIPDLKEPEDELSSLMNEVSSGGGRMTQTRRRTRRKK